MKTIFSILFLLLSSICFAQNTTPKNELGLHLYGNEMSILNKNLRHLLFNGIQYKYSLTNGYWLRSSFQYASESTTFDDEATNAFWSKSNNNNKIFDTRLGIEKVFFTSKIKPFVLLDVGYRIENNEGAFSRYGDFPPYYHTGYYNNTNYYLGAFVGVGLKYYPTEHLYLSAETNIGFNTPLFEGNLNPIYYQYFNPIKTIAFGVRF